MFLIDKLPARIYIGNEGEENATQVQLDVSAWDALYPDAVYSITYVRPGETTVYPEVPSHVVHADGVLTWTPSESVLDISDYGTVVINCTEDDVKKKSTMMMFFVARSHPSSGAAPDPIADWISDATSKLAEVDHFVGDTIEAAEAANEAAGLTTDAIARATEISEIMEGIAPLWSDVDISVSALGEGAAPTASITQGETGTSISLGIPKGDTGAQGIQGEKGDGYKPKGQYLSNVQYEYLNVVTDGGSSYAYIYPTPAAGVPVTDTSHWQQIAEKGDTGPSAYDAAVAGGYTGTEEEFNAANAGIESAKDNAGMAAQEANEAALNANEAAESIPAEVTDQINTRLGGLSFAVDPTDKGLNITYTY